MEVEAVEEAMAAAMAAVMAAMAAVKAVLAAVEAVMTVMAVMAAMVAALYILLMPVRAASGGDGFTRRRPPSANFYEVTVSIYVLYFYPWKKYCSRKWRWHVSHHTRYLLYCTVPIS